MDSEIKIGHNVYGGNWVTIEVSKEITTQVAVFRRINEAQVSDFLKNPEVELFQGKQFKY